MSTSLRDFPEAALSPRESLQIKPSTATLERTAPNPETRIPPRMQPGPWPLSFAQERIWFLDQLEPNSPVYNVPTAVRIRGPLEIAALQEALNTVVVRHEALRTVFASENGTPMQSVEPPRPVPLLLTDLRSVRPAQREATARRLAKEDVRRTFDLSRDQLLHAAAYRLDDAEHVVALTMHHVASDGWSVGVVLRELREAYRAYAAKRAPALPALPIQYPDFAVWQRQWLQGPVLKSLLEFWHSRLDRGIDFEQLPTDHPRPSRQTYNGALETMLLSDSLTRALAAVGQRERATLFMTLVAAFQALLHRYSGKEKVVLAFPIANRTRSETYDLIGYFANTLLLRSDLAGDPEFLEVLRSVREFTLNAFLHQDLPFEKLVEQFQPERSLSHSPLFQILFAFQNSLPSPAEWKWPDASIEPFEVDTGTAKFDLTVLVERKQSGLAISLEYNTGLFDTQTIKGILRHYRQLLEGVAENPRRRISALPLASEPERKQVVVEWNATRREYPRQCVQELFQTQVRRAPNATAVVCNDQKLSYYELNGYANRLAGQLRAAGVGPESKVAVCSQRCAEVIVALLAILKAGAAYLPLDPEDPPDRLAFMMENAGVQAVITWNKWLPALPAGSAKPICIDDLLASELHIKDQEDLASGTTPENLAYVIYTSGSTGMPKGVEVLHRGIVRLLFGQDYCPFDDKQIFLLLSSLCFDLSTLEIWAPLLHGGTCVVFPNKLNDFRQLGEVIRKNRVTTMWLTSTLFNMIVDEAAEELASVRRILVGGEALSVPHVQRALGRLPRLELINGYGPTESTTFASCYKIPKHLPANIRSIPIGRPIANTQYYILDSRMQPVPPGLPGELYIGGDGLARGYLNQPELTREKFVPHPFSQEPADRLYRSGDLARYLPDGNVEFLGRIDGQVKIRGFRIELGEIEATLAGHEKVRAAAAAACPDGQGGKRLVAYVVAAGTPSPTVADLRNFMSQKLPDYMVPFEFLFLPALPILSSGKVDRRALPVPSGTLSASELTYLAPRDSLERKLTEVWERVLGKHPIGIKDNFFELGGHSLLALRLFSEIERTFHKKLHLSTVISTPTIESMAVSLREQQAPALSYVVPIQTHGSKPPFYCVHGGGGHVLRFRDLALGLGSDQPFYGLRSPEFNGRPFEVTVENLATTYIREIQKMQTEGPYYLAGASFGGLVAYEMACQLAAQGEHVALLALFDTGNPTAWIKVRAEQSIQKTASYWSGKIKRYARKFAGRSWRERPKLMAHLLRSAGTHAKYAFWNGAFAFYRLHNRPLPATLRDNLKLFTLVGKNYRPGPYPGRLILFKAEEQEEQYGPDPALGWANVAQGGVEIYDVPGDHLTMLDQPRVFSLAKQLRACLETAQAQWETARDLCECT